MIQWWTPGFWPPSPLPKGTCCSFPSWLGVLLLHGLLSWVSGKGDTVSISGSRRSPEGGLGNPLQYSCLKYPMDRGAWWATVHAVTKSQTHLRNSMHTCMLLYLPHHSPSYTELLLQVMFVSPWNQNTNLLYFFFQNLIQSLAQSGYLLFVR